MDEPKSRTIINITESECALLEDLFRICAKDTGNTLIRFSIDRDGENSIIIPIIMRETGED